MPRHRKNDPTTVLSPLVERFAARLASTVERFTISRIERAVKEQAKSARGSGRGRGGLGRARRRSPVLCYYPGCKNLAAPRFGMFCAALHKDISKAEKEKYRARHLKAEQKSIAAKRGRRKK